MGRPKSRITKQCEMCGTTYEVVPSLASRSRFCSIRCRNRAGADASRKPERRNLCPCGRPVPQFSEVSGKKTYTYRKYCSDGCREMYQARRQPDPANYVDLICETCEKPFTRRKSFPGAHRFCSNECAAKWTRKIRHIGIKDADVVLDSGWEALFWGLCCFLKVPVERFNRAGCVPHGDGWYGPDFLVADLYVEVKGVEDDDDRSRVEAWRATGKAVAVVDRDALSEWVEKGVTKDDFLFKLLTLSQPSRRHTKV